MTDLSPPEEFPETNDIGNAESQPIEEVVEEDIIFMNPEEESTSKSYKGYFKKVIMIILGLCGLFLLYKLLKFLFSYFTSSSKTILTNSNEGQQLGSSCRKPPQFINSEQYDTAYLLSKGPVENKMVHNLKCSKDCCWKQWPVPFMNNDPSNKWMPTGLTCSNEYTSGCVCVDKGEWNYLVSHGGNN